MSASAGPGLAVEQVSRGAAFGDYDNDGDIDIFVVNLDASATLLRNDFEVGNGLVVQLLSSVGNRDVLGARVRLEADGKSQWRTINGASSYLSYNDIRAHFGLGAAKRADIIEIIWPDGTRRKIEAVPANSLLLVHQDGAQVLVDLE